MKTRFGGVFAALIAAVCLFGASSALAAPQDAKPDTKPSPTAPAAPKAGKKAEKGEKAEKKASTKFKKAGDGTVNLNTATTADLQKLPGVGPSIAQRILEKRAELGGKFSEIDQLAEVKGIGDKSLERLKPFIVLK